MVFFVSQKQFEIILSFRPTISKLYRKGATIRCFFLRPTRTGYLPYERLSRDDFGKDDDQQRESNSISNQKAMLEEFAARQGFTNIVHFTDDGISGTCFDRPGFLAMMKEVEAGNVEYLCIKDMSRMGRDYLKVGQIIRFFHPTPDIAGSVHHLRR